MHIEHWSHKYWSQILWTSDY